MKKPPNSWGAKLTETTFSDSDMKLFGKYFQKVISRELIGSVILCNSENELQSEKQRLNQNNGIFLKKDHKAIEKYLCYKKYDLLEKEETVLYDDRSIISFYKYNTVYGFYLEDIFEHPFKDCNHEFYLKYNSGEHYSELKVFEEACDLQFEEYRFDSYEDFENLRKKFREYLINQYTYGSSILCYF